MHAHIFALADLTIASLSHAAGQHISDAHKDPRGAFVTQLREFMQLIKSDVVPTGRALFRSCPRGTDRGQHGCGNGGGCDEPYRALLKKTGWELFDVFRVSDELFAFQQKCSARARAAGGKAWWRVPNCTQAYTDNWHFQCDGYRELNRLMLDSLLCKSSVPQPKTQS